LLWWVANLTAVVKLVHVAVCAGVEETGAGAKTCCFFTITAVINYFREVTIMRINHTNIISGSISLIALLLAACGSGGGGSGSTAASSPTAFAYVTSTNGVSAFTIDASTGALTSVGTVAAGNAPSSVTVDPTGKFAYVANSSSGDVSAYNINTSTGALTQIDCGGGAGCNAPFFSKNFMAGNSPSSVTIDPTGKFAYVANFATTGNVSAYTINPGTGALTQIDCGGGAGCNAKNFVAGTYPKSVTVAPTGDFAYVANQNSNDVSAYTINIITGALTQINCGGGAGCSTAIPANFAAGTNPQSIIVDTFIAYVANAGTNDVSAYSFDIITGVLTQINCGGGSGCNGNNFAAGNAPQSVTSSPSGKLVYVANYVSKDVSAYSTDGSGALIQVNCGGGAGCNGKNFLAGNSPNSITVDPTGKFAYVANITGIDVYAINASTGALAKIGTMSVAGGYISITTTAAK
jgi:6-phosphogluconolactonase